MFHYQRNLLSQTDECTAEIFTQIVTSSQTLKTIEDIRELNRQADALEAQARPNDAKAKREEAGKRKKSLAGFLFQATFCETASKKGIRGRWRKQTAARLTGLYVCDFDHITNPREVYDGWIEKYPSDDPMQPGRGLAEALGICLVYISPSGHGLKVVATASVERGNLIDNQRWLAAQLGMETDEACKDASRLSFACGLTDILFIHKQTLFEYDNPEYDKTFGDSYRSGDSSASIPFIDECAKTDGSGGVYTGHDDGTGAEMGDGPSDGAHATVELEVNDEGQPCFKSVPYATIEQAYWAANGGEPSVGERHTRMLKFFGRLRYICDNNPQVVIRVAQHRGLDDAELNNLASSACSKPLYAGMPKDLRDVLESCGIPTAQATSGAVMDQPAIDYDYWWHRLEPLLCDGFTEAAAGVPDHVKMGAVLAAGAMFGTYLTRCWFRHYDGKEMRLSYIVYIVGDAASGKSFIIDLDREIMACMKQADKPGRAWERQYKEDRAQRLTSSKNQKAAAQEIKHPVIRYVPSTISNAILYRRLTDAYDEKEDMHLHLYTMESELATALRVQQGSWAGKLDLELKSFQNEEAGVDYANADSANGLIQVNWNQVISGTMDALQRKVRPANILDGYATRLAVFLMPSNDFAMIDREQVVRNHQQREALKQWGYRLDSLRGEIPAQKLVDAAYKWVAEKTNEARLNEDHILDYFRKRVPIYMVRYGIVHAILNDYDNFAATGKLNITRKTLDFARLIGDFILYMQMYMFGQQVQDAQERVRQNFVPFEKVTKITKLYNRLGDTFTVEDVMQLSDGLTRGSAHVYCSKWVSAMLVKRVSRGKYQKTIKKI